MSDDAPRTPTFDPTFEPTEEQRRQVEVLARTGLAHKHIAAAIFNRKTGKPIALHTLRKYFERELAEGPPPRRGRGGPKFVPTDEQRRLVAFLAGIGMPQELIARLVENPNTGRPIAVAILAQNFRRELDTGAPELEARAARTIAQRAFDLKHPQGAICAMFLLKTRFAERWRQNDQITHQIASNSGVLIAPSKRTPEQWIEEQTSKNGRRKPPGKR